MISRRPLHRASAAEVWRGGLGVREVKVCKVGRRLLQELASMPICSRLAASPQLTAI